MAHQPVSACDLQVGKYLQIEARQDSNWALPAIRVLAIGGAGGSRMQRQHDSSTRLNLQHQLWLMSPHSHDEIGTELLKAASPDIMHHWWPAHPLLDKHACL